MKINQFSKARFLYPNQTLQAQKELEQQKQWEEKVKSENDKTRRAKVLRMEEEARKVDIEVLLMENGLDLNNLPKNVDWLPLEMFDDVRFDDKNGQEWMEFFVDETGEKIDFTAKALVKDDTDFYIWEKCRILDFRAKDKTWEVQFDDGEKMKLKRLQLLFDVENREKFVERLSRAIVDRIYMDSKVRYEFYINSMPVGDLGSLDEVSMANIVKQAKNLRKLRESASLDVETEVSTMNDLYTRTMNKILFDKYLKDNGGKNNMLPNQLILPELEIEEDEVPEKGMIEVERVDFTYEPKGEDYSYPSSKDFTEIFQDVCLESIFTKRCAIQALHEIKAICLAKRNEKVFKMKIDRALKYHDFKQEQETSTKQLVYSLKIQWIEEISRIIRSKFEDERDGWFNLTEANPKNYKIGKLHSFLQLVKLEMQDTLTDLVRNSFFKFVDFIESFIPEKTELDTVVDVTNTYSDGYVSNSKMEEDFKRAHIPLFYVELKIIDGKIKYSDTPSFFKGTVLKTFSLTLKELGTIPDIETRILDSKFKKRLDNSLSCPELLDPKMSTQYSNEEAKAKVRNNLWIWNLYKRLEESITKGISPLEEYIKFFDQFNEVLELKPEQFVKKYDNPNNRKSIDFILEEISKFREKSIEMEENIMPNIQVGCFNVDCTDIKTKIGAIFKDVCDSLIKVLVKRASVKVNEIENKYLDIQRQITEEPQDIEDLTKLNEFIEVDMPLKIGKLMEETKGVMSTFDRLEDIGCKFDEYGMSENDMNLRWKIYKNPSDIMKNVGDRQDILSQKKKQLYEQMKSEQANFKQSLDNLETEILSFYKHSQMTLHSKMNEDVSKIQQDLKELVEKSRKFNSREGLFESDVTDYTKIGNMMKEFDPYFNLWNNVDRWFDGSVKWMEGEWEKVNATEAQNFVDDGSRSLGRVLKYFKDKDPIKFAEQIQIADTAKKQIDAFKPKVPLLVALRREGMRGRHWDAISRESEIDINPLKIQNFNFNWLLEKGMLDHLVLCQEVGEKASKEYRIEKGLENMEEEWKKIELGLQDFKNTALVTGFDDIELILDEHLATTGAMMINPFNKYFQDRIEDWNTKMVTISNVIEEWRIFQKQWAYLQPIFASSDISRQLPEAYTLFKGKPEGATKFHLDQITRVKENKNALEIATGEDFLENLEKYNEKLEFIQTELNTYLESKRKKFARFYFLADDELLNIVSQTKEVERVQDHLRKVFENINRLQFDDEKQIHAMYSVEGEKVGFTEILDPVGKQVEDWMLDVENQMKKSVKEELIQSVEAYVQTNRTDWIFQHPGQCVLNGSQIHFTLEVEEAIRTGTLPQYIEKLEKQLLDVVKLDRSEFNAMKSVTVEALITIDVHNLDVVKLLHSMDAQDVGIFEWISQLRYYLEDEKVWVRCIQTNFPYGYEYLGNMGRLVITPLTDKCYMTLMGALQLNLGGAPAGPAGTGKTETVKDLAKAVAVKCVVFNCQPSMTYKFVGKYFKGLASSGAWCCFDEFNRINIEVLSVIAQQLQELFNAKAEGKSEISFEGIPIKVLPTFSVYITMNPGYAGRTELPDNLNALFRYVAMMVPNYALIAQIKLYAFGFTQAESLANKMVATFQLSSQQLSDQKHYDYGMRAVSSVIKTAGLMKRRTDETDEGKLLLRALRDVNVPKFLKQDIELFENIIKDLFPNTERPTYEYGMLLDAINKSCEKLNLQPIDPFIKKVLQLYDTMQVRHGLMLVGPTGGGKTSNYNVLMNAITELANEGEQYKKVLLDIINPKSATNEELYGFSRDINWEEGIIELIMERAINNQHSDQFNWIMFDGPVDAIWIESMNTVLDDNKKLCLSSGKVLMISPLMTIMFEVEDLEEASPATVSRCGMVYMEPESMGIKHFITSFINTWPVKIHEKKIFVPTFLKFLDIYFYPLLSHLRSNLKECVKTMDNNIISSFIRLFTCMALTPMPKTEDQVEQIFKNLEDLVIFCVIWSVCCTTDVSGRQELDFILKRIMKDTASKVSFKKNDEEKTLSIYDYKYLTDEKRWEPWTKEYSNYDIPDDSGFGDIVIPTSDYIRMTWVTKLLVTNSHHVMTPGPTGTGKSINAYKLLSIGLTDAYTGISICLSAQTTANQILDTIWVQCGKRGKGVFCPLNSKKGIIFVDDLNMPKKEEYGAQPPLELLRQYLDHKAWYIMKQNKEYIKFMDLTFLTAMGPPGGGRNTITERLVRHFNIIAYTELTDNVITSIFNQIVGFFLRRFNDTVKELIPKTIEASLALYNEAKKVLLPKPGKTHYTFNLRDISKVFQGVCYASSKHIIEPMDLARLVYHENLRVYHDRLTTTEDRELLIQKAKSLVSQSIGIEEDQIMNSERIIFADFMASREQDSASYHQVVDLSQFVKRIVDYLNDYNNEMGAKKAMKLVMFLDACEHISRICRVLRQPNGHMLLMGVGGSGRQSLAKLSSYILDLKLFQIEVVKGYGVREWREDLKKLIKAAVLENKEMSFIFVDTQIVNESMVEDINVLLNSGAIVGLPFNQDEEKDLEEVGRNDCLRKNLVPNKINIYNQRIKRIKNNTHIVLAMSPLSDDFSRRLRMFPSFINCCALDWFTEWPDEALIGVGVGALAEYSVEFKIEEQFDDIIDMFRLMHKSVEEISIRYEQELRRHNYVTPTSYLELLTLYKSILKMKNEESQNLIKRFKDGLQTLKEAEIEVQKLKKKLEEDQPKLEKANIETEKLLGSLKIDQAKANKKSMLVQKEKKEVAKKQAEANQMKMEAQIKKEESDRVLEETLKDVKKIKPGDISEMKSFSSPPSAIGLVAKALCLMLLTEEQVPKFLNKKDDEYWKITKTILFEKPKTLFEIMTDTYDKDNIEAKRLRKLRKVCINDAEWNDIDMKKSNVANELMYKWVNAMVQYNKEYTESQPLRDRLAKTEEELAKTSALLKMKQDQVDEVNKRVKEIEGVFIKKKNEKEHLERKIGECEVFLERASKLTFLLADEKKRWGEEIVRISKEAVLVPHDALIAAGMVAYAGPFVASYRTELETSWVEKLKEKGLVHTENTRMSKFLGDPVKILGWNLNGLPKDDTSIENGIIIDNSRRWPLMIDPQNQANKYIKSMGFEINERFEPIKASSTNLMRSIEQKIQFGEWALVENVGVNLDPALEPVLQKKVIMVGGSKSINIGDKSIPYNDEFKLFMTTTNPNPHYSPEISAKVTIINFGITSVGLEEQMLAQIVILENPEIERRKSDIVKSNAADKKKLKELEDEILISLGRSDNILMDETLIVKLSESKKTSAEINQRMEESIQAEIEIDKARESYRKAAFRASLLYFCITNLNEVNSMYQYSLQWFEGLFKLGIQNSPAHPETSIRVGNIIEYFTYSLYENVCRSLFGEHKLMFSFILTINILKGDDLLNLEELRYLLAGNSQEVKMISNPTDWIDENSWPKVYEELVGLNGIAAFEGILDHFTNNLESWKKIYDSEEPHNEELPAPWNEKLDSFHKIMTTKALRSDKVVNSIQNFIRDKMDKKFVEVPVFNLEEVFKDSTCASPLIFVLSTGSDPKSDFDAFSAEKEIKNIKSISLGQGQGEKAEKLIKEASKASGSGGWVLLQNCHLAISWMPKLEAICEEFHPDMIHPDFRLWLTSNPDKNFPISVLQNSVKMTLEPPSGLKDNLKLSYSQMDDKLLGSCAKTDEFKKLLFGLCFFHAIIQERRKFGPIGWNKPYKFTNEDLGVCRIQLKLFLEEYEDVPYKVLNFICAEINYGGRVTDSIDKRLIRTIFRGYMNEDMMEDDFKLSASGIYFSPEAGMQADYLNYVDKLPLDAKPEVFGLHDNAEITNAQNETRKLLETVLSIQPRSSSSSGKSREEIIEEIATFIESKIPESFNFKEVSTRYPTKYEESMNTVLVQEVAKYNKLINIVKTSLYNLKRGLKGFITLNEELEKVANSLFNQQVPTAWGDIFLSLKPLISWVTDFQQRVTFFRRWVEKGKPNVFWFSGFCFPQAFITGTLQNYARKEKVSIDRISFDFKFIDDKELEDITEPAENGIYVNGLFLEGSKWNFDSHKIDDPVAKELFSSLPILHLIPIIDRKEPEEGIYKCPVYKVTSRFGTLSTTGHSTNFVMFVEIPSDREEDYWIKAGVAGFLSLRT